MEMHDTSRIVLEEALEAHPKGTREQSRGHGPLGSSPTEPVKYLYLYNTTRSALETLN